ncbi:MAG: 6-carboxytetrahydropterin synthase [Bacteroidales bacterium]|nr:6-carboxytetrahydropterin synthase [Candidatus Physcousia equi]
MYYIQKRMEVAGCHRLQLPYPSKCSQLHGHNWIITVFCKAQQLNESGMVVDFTAIKERIQQMLDHKNLNEVFDFNPTAENIAKWVCDQTPHCYRVEVQESIGNIAIYERE